jgi:hypothetical protein
LCKLLEHNDPDQRAIRSGYLSAHIVFRLRFVEATRLLIILLRQLAPSVGSNYLVTFANIHHNIPECFPRAWHARMGLSDVRWTFPFSKGPIDTRLIPPARYSTYFARNVVISRLCRLQVCKGGLVLITDCPLAFIVAQYLLLARYRARAVRTGRCVLALLCLRSQRGESESRVSGIEGLAAR